MSSSSGLRDLESEFVLSEQLDLLVAVSLFVVHGPFVNVPPILGGYLGGSSAVDRMICTGPRSPDATTFESAL